MALGCFGLGALMAVLFYPVVHRMKAFTWMPNVIGTFLGCVVIIGLGVVMSLAHTAHTMFTAAGIAFTGVPLYLLTNKFPAPKQERKYPR